MIYLKRLIYQNTPSIPVKSVLNQCQTHVRLPQCSHFAEKFKGYWFELDDSNHTQWDYVLINNAGQLAKETPQGFCDQFEINAMQLI